MKATFSILALAVCLACSCAETDPYKRLESGPSEPLPVADALDAYATRWPDRFKAVQTVTLDFGMETRTLVGYLIVQRPGRFRLQGMSEQGLKLFDIAYDNGRLQTVFTAEEFDASILENVSRDITRIYMDFTDDDKETGPSSRWDIAQANEAGDGTTLRIAGSSGSMIVNLVGTPALIDSYELEVSDRWLYRVDQYEWKDLGDHFGPSVIVLRERGIQSDGPPYKLTIKITEFETREEPWPDSVFDPPEDE